MKKKRNQRYRIILEYKENIKNYWWYNTENQFSEEESNLSLLFESFNIGSGDIEVESDEQQVYIQNLLFLDDQGNCPTLIISKKNHEQIINIWNKNIENPATYLMLVQDDSGWVKLEPKSNLLEDDLQAIEEDKQAKLEREKK